MGDAGSSGTEKIEFCVNCAMVDDPNHNLALKKFDRVYIRTTRGWQEERIVTLKGEFVYPGDYVVIDGETLGDIIGRAGGFSDDAYLSAAVFTRPSVRQLEQRRLDEYISRLEQDAVKMTTELAIREQDMQSARQLMTQQQMLMEKLKNTEPVGRVVIDLSDKQEINDFLLENGDLCMVPRMSATVSVIGEVYNAATFQLEKRRSATEYYLEQAGGLKDNADKRNIYIFRANGSVLTRKSTNIMRADLSPGDVVVVPQKLQYINRFKYFMDALQAGVQLATISSLVATILLAAK